MNVKVRFKRTGPGKHGTTTHDVKDTYVTKVCPIYLPPTIGGGFWAGKISVTLDGTDLLFSEQEEQLSVLYTTAVRTFAKRGIKNRRFGPKFNNLYVKKGPTEEPVKSMLIDHDDLLNPTPISLNWSCETAWPLSNQTCTMESLDRQKIDSGYLHPSCDVLIKITKRALIDSLIEQCATSDAVYFSFDDEGVNEKILVEFIDASIAIEYVDVQDSKLLDSINNGISRYYTDVPTMRLQGFSSKQSYVESQISVPPGTRVLFIAWPVEQQLYSSVSKKKSLTPKLKFPLGLVALNLQLRGRYGKLCLSEGLTNLGTNAANGDPSMRQYVQYLKERDMYDATIDELCPKIIADGVCQIIAVDLSPFNLTESTDLSISCVFNASLSPEKTYLWTACLRPFEVVYNGKEKKWTWGPIVGPAPAA